jgi:GAF domain-containing protein
MECYFDDGASGPDRAQRARFTALDIRALVLIPLVFSEQLIGLLSVRIADNRQVDGANLEFAQSLAQQAPP